MPVSWAKNVIMQKCQKVLRDILPSLFKDEPETVISAVADVLTRLAVSENVRIHEVQALVDGVDALLLMDEWRLVQPVGGSMTKAWEDVSQLIASRDDLGLTLPPWVKTLIQLACNTNTLPVRKAILTFFSDEGHPAWLKMPQFLFEMAGRSEHGVVDSVKINRLLREMPLGISADTLIAQLKNYGFISPHLRADFFRMQSPHYEVHPMIIYAAAHGKGEPGNAGDENPFHDL